MVRLLLTAMLCAVLSLVQGGHTLLSASNAPANSGASINQSNNQVRGIVTDKAGEPIPGVFVQIKGTKTAVMTDAQGKYSIEAPALGKKYVLLFQYVGMSDKSVTVSKATTINVVLESDSNLDASVIVGAYGAKQKREDLVGSAFQINSDQLKNLPKDRVEDLLQGAVPGMKVEANSDYAGSPRTRYNIRVRGTSSMSASSEPLWIVDGVPMYTGSSTNTMPGMSYTVSPLSYINPDDIESMTVLKDADQTSIYGANGSNGVILITTKSGSYNTPLRLTANVSYGISMPDYSTMFKMMTADQYREVAQEAWVNAGNDMKDYPFVDNPYNSYSTTSTDWARLYLSPASTVNASLSLRNGTKKMANTISASFYSDNNIQHSNTTRRFTLNERNQIKIHEKVRLDFNLSAAFTLNELFPISNSYLDALPIYEPYNADGSYRLYNYLYYKVLPDGKESYTKKKFHDNEIPDALENENNQLTVVTSASANLRVNIVKGLDFNTQFKAHYQHSHEDQFTSIKTVGGIDSNGNPYGAAGRADASYLDWTSISQLSYDRTFGRHRINAMGVFELRHHRHKTLSASGYGFINDYIQEMSYLDKENLYTNSSTTVNRNLSYLGRLEYNYDKRYYIAGNFRRDGSSDFGIYSQWDNFWSVGLSWNVHNEPFFEADNIDMLKFKVSVGDNGNSRTGNSTFEGTWTYSPSYSYNGKVGSQLGTVANPYLSWEKTRNFNVGFRMEILDKRLNFEVEYYNNNTRDLISKIYTSRTISSDRIFANVGKLNNQGLEFTLESMNISRNAFTWTTRFNAAHNRNRITELYNDMPTSYGTTVDAVGHSRSAYYLVRWAGVDPADGSPMWYDLNGNITKTYSTDNRVIIDNDEIVFGSLTNYFTLRNWTLSFQINYNIGGLVLASYADRFMSDGYNIIDGNQAVEVYYYRWKKPGDIAAFPKVSNSSTGSTYSSTRNLYDKTYFDLYNVALTYNIPSGFLRKLKIADASLTLSGNNLYFLTPHQNSQFNSYKTMAHGYPRVRRISLALNVTF